MLAKILEAEYRPALVLVFPVIFEVPSSSPPCRVGHHRVDAGALPPNQIEINSNHAEYSVAVAHTAFRRTSNMYTSLMCSATAQVEGDQWRCSAAVSVAASLRDLASDKHRQRQFVSRQCG